MALPTVHVICGFAGGDGGQSDKQGIFKDPQWSEAPAANTPSTNGATDKGGLRPVFRVILQADVYFSHTGQPPNAANSPRHLLMAKDSPHDIYVTGGDKFAWVLAT